MMKKVPGNCSVFNYYVSNQHHLLAKWLTSRLVVWDNVHHDVQWILIQFYQKVNFFFFLYRVLEECLHHSYLKVSVTS